MREFSHDVIILGGGAAGLTAASGCAQLGLHVALVEPGRMGGDCLYTGCVPSKTLIKSARVLQLAREAGRYGLPPVQLPHPDLPRALERVKAVITTLEPHDSPERFRGLGVDVRLERARFTSEHVVRLESGDSLSARTILLATGSAPKSIPVPGLEKAGYITNEHIFELPALPSSLITIGAGPIGLELSQALLRLGSRVTVVDVAPQVLPLEDEDMASVVQRRLEAEGAVFHLGAKLTRVEAAEGGRRVVLTDRSGQERVLEAEQILLAVGRKGNTEGLEAEKAGLEIKGGFFVADAGLVTSRRNIMAIGDCNGRYLFTHVAGAEGSLAVRRTVLRLPVHMDYSRVPWVTYTDPEVASVGYNEKRAKAAGLAFTAVEAPFAEVDRAQIESETEGKAKILIDRSGRVIGCQIAGAHAGELLGPAILAVRHRLKLMDLMSAMVPYPTLSEVYKKAAGAYFAPRVYNERIRRLLRLVFGYGRGRA